MFLAFASVVHVALELATGGQLTTVLQYTVLDGLQEVGIAAALMALRLPRAIRSMRTLLTVTLVARILDPEEGLLQGDSVVWTTTPTVNGVTLDKSTLGRGDILGGVALQTYRCTVSSHLITVSARDFEGAQASASVTVTVGPGPADAAACP